MPKSREGDVPGGMGSEEQVPGQNSASRRVPLPLPSVIHSSRPVLGSSALNSTLSWKLHRDLGLEPARKGLPGVMSFTRYAVWAAADEARARPERTSKAE